MDKFTLISNITGSLAWPVATFLLVFMLKADLGKALSNIRRLKHKDTEIDFGKELKETAAVASESGSLLNNDTPNDSFNELALLSPRGAVIESWLRVEKSLHEFAERHGIETDTKKPFRIQNIIWHNLDYNALGKGTIDVLERLRRLRNEAVHLKDSNISHDSAKEYQSLSKRVIQVVQQA
jgi:hypothetical protein